MTNENTFTVNLRVINALAKIAPKKDIRYYLQSVCVEAAPDAIYYVATNGHMLTVVREEYQECDSAPDKATQYLIPREIAAKVKPGKHGLDHGVLSIAPKTTIGGDPAPAEFTLRNGETIGGTLVDGTFPDWRRVVPRELSGATAQFNPDYHALRCGEAPHGGGSAGSRPLLQRLHARRSDARLGTREAAQSRDDRRALQLLAR